MTTDQQATAALIYLKMLTEAGQNVVDNWEQGDLAGAVNILEATCIEVNQFLDRIAQLLPPAESKKD